MAKKSNARWFLAVSNEDLLAQLDLLGGKRSTTALRALELGINALLAETGESSTETAPPAPTSPAESVSTPEPTPTLSAEDEATLVPFEVFHERLIGVAPTPTQRQLYEAFPDCRGYDHDGEDKERFTAVLVMGMHQTRQPADDTSRDVVLAIPKVRDEWAVNAINELLRDVAARLAKLPNRRKVNAQIVRAMQHLQMGSRVFGDEPPHWVAFGFSSQTPAPPWLTAKLLGVINDHTAPNEPNELDELVALYA